MLFDDDGGRIPAERSSRVVHKLTLAAVGQLLSRLNSRRQVPAATHCYHSVCVRHLQFMPLYLWEQAYGAVLYLLWP